MFEILKCGVVLVKFSACRIMFPKSRSKPHCNMVTAVSMSLRYVIKRQSLVNISSTGTVAVEPASVTHIIFLNIAMLYKRHTAYFQVVKNFIRY